MTALEFKGVVKDYRGLRPLRVADLSIVVHERVALAGLDVPAAEVFINLATGAGVPDQGQVRVMGEPTTAITEADAWLTSLDTFGIVSHRAVLLDAMTVAQNIAMSFSLSIEPIPSGTRAQVDALAAATDITPEELERQAGAVSGAARMRVHLARALALEPKVLVLEHPTISVERSDVRTLAASIVRATSDRAIAVLALTDDEALAKGLGGRRLKLNAATGGTENWGRVSFFRFLKK
ncbi:MAG: ATP-binding cassette domain-containing protein [Vicinamibacterales bacterium]